MPTSVFYAILVFGTDHRFCQISRERTFAPGVGRVWFSSGCHFVWMRAIAGRPFARLRNEFASLPLIRRGAKWGIQVEVVKSPYDAPCGWSWVAESCHTGAALRISWVSTAFLCATTPIGFRAFSMLGLDGFFCLLLLRLTLRAEARHTRLPLSQPRSPWNCQPSSHTCKTVQYN
jgi:hypothetical protein